MKKSILKKILITIVFFGFFCVNVAADQSKLTINKILPNAQNIRRFNTYGFYAGAFIAGASTYIFGKNNLLIPSIGVITGIGSMTYAAKRAFPFPFGGKTFFCDGLCQRVKADSTLMNDSDRAHVLARCPKKAFLRNLGITAAFAGACYWQLR